MRRYPESAVERAMKVQEVLLRAMSGQPSWLQAGEILGLGPRQVLRLRQRFAADGCAGLFDRRREPSPKRVPPEYRAEHPSIRWQLMAAFRDVLIHGDEGVDLGRVWTTATRDLPAFRDAIAGILPPLDQLERELAGDDPNGAA